MPSSSTAPTIRYLADVPDLLPSLVAWFESEWEVYYGPRGPGAAEAHLREAMNRDVLPLGLVAVSDDGAPLGTISLRESSRFHEEWGPWGSAFLVDPTRRGQGVGTALVAALEQEARRLGFPWLYMATDSGIVERRGWRAVDSAKSLRRKITVYKIDL